MEWKLLYSISYSFIAANKLKRVALEVSGYCTSIRFVCYDGPKEFAPLLHYDVTGSDINVASTSFFLQCYLISADTNCDHMKILYINENSILTKPNRVSLDRYSKMNSYIISCNRKPCILKSSDLILNGNIVIVEAILFIFSMAI